MPSVSVILPEKITPPTLTAPVEATVANPAIHLPVLDALRGMAVLLVISYHWMLSYYALPVHGYLRTMIPIMDTWGCGVDLFFVLSGFLITRILIQAKGTKDGLKHFYIRRALRIFPLYYAVLFITLVAVPHSFREHALNMPNHHSATPLWFYATNLAQTFSHEKWIYGGLDHLWSLAVEEHFYLLWPMAVFLLPRRSLTYVTTALIVLAVATRFFFVQCLHDNSGAYLFSICRVDGLAAGALLAVLNMEGKLTKRLNPIFLFCLLGLPLGWYLQHNTNVVIEFTFMHLACSLGFAGLLALAVLNHNWLPVRFLNNPVLRFFGLYSYGMYMFHNILRPPLVPLTLIYGVDKPNNAAIAYGIVNLGLTLALAMMSYRLLERPFLRLKDKLAPSVDPPVTALPAAALAPATLS